MWPGNPLAKAGGVAPVHMYGERENATVGITMGSHAGNMLGRERKAPELWYLRRISGRQSGEAWCHGTTWSTLSHGHCFDCWVIHPSPSQILNRSEKLPKYLAYFWAAQAKHGAAHSVPVTPQQRLRHPDPSIYSVHLKCRVQGWVRHFHSAATSCILPFQRELKH